MVKVQKFFAYFIFFIFALIYFVPKTSIYYFIEKELKNYEIVISNEELQESSFNLHITGGTVSVKSIESANIDQADMKIYGLYNTIELQEIVLSKTVSSFLPSKIKNATVSYTVFNPTNIQVKASGEFGEADAQYNLLNKTLYLKLKPSKKMLTKYRSTLNSLKKSENGEYIYEQNI
ncbi:MAG: hypothetical protein KAT10_02825 [Sulfurimonas sp.]|nr:hypothetical protein [Sulfurimonas sp.]